MADTNAMLAALFGAGLNDSRSGTDISQLLSSLNTSNIYKQAAIPVVSTKFDTSTWSPGQTAGVTAAQAFLGGLLNNYGERQIGQQAEAVASMLPKIYADPLSAVAPEGVPEEAFQGLRLSALKQNALKDDKFDNEKTDLFAKMFAQAPGLALKTMPDVASKFGIVDPTSGLTAPAEEPAPDAGPLSSLVKGGKSYLQKFKETQNDLIQSGTPKAQAAIEARNVLAAEQKANMGSFDAAKEARKQGQDLLDLSITAKTGIERAGETGSFPGVRNALDYVASEFGSTDSEQKLVGNTLLKSIAPEIVKAGRSPGAVSDRETRMLIESGPSVNNKPEANKILAQKMEDLGKLNLDYADFLETYRDLNNGSTLGADRKWSEYRQAVPLIMGDGKDAAVNKARMPWQEFFAQQGGGGQQMKMQRNKKTGEVRWVPK